MHTRNTGGYSVIEIIIYVAIFAMLSIAVIHSFVTVSSSFGATRVNRNLLEAGSTIMERLTREIRQSTSIDVTSSTLGSSPSVLQMNTLAEDGTPTTVKFIIESGVIDMYTGGALIGSLHSNRISIPTLIFRKISTTESEAVKIELTLQDATGKSVRTESFYDTVVLRGTY